MQAAKEQIDALQISVVIPTYNRGHLLGRAINSALEQTKQPAEIIVVDDGSQDDTAQVAAAYADRVHYIYQQNGGTAVARHTGVQAAASNWAAFLDSDDYWDAQHLERMAGAIVATDGRARFYFANAGEQTALGNESFWANRGFAIEGVFEFREDAADWVMRPRQPMHLIVSVINRAAYLASGGFLAALRNREDTHLFLKLGLGAPACAVAGVGGYITADDAPENRLTLVLAQQAKKGHTYRVIMFNDLLAQDIAPAPRGVLRNRLAKAHYRLAGLHWREGDWKTAVTHLIRSLQNDPKASYQLLTRQKPDHRQQITPQPAGVKETAK